MVEMVMMEWKDLAFAAKTGELVGSKGPLIMGMRNLK
jgi:hypothetical protein